MFKNLRLHEGFWQDVTAALMVDVPLVPPLPSELEQYAYTREQVAHNDTTSPPFSDVYNSANTPKPGVDRSWLPPRLARHCYQLSARAAALEIVAIELYYNDQMPPYLRSTQLSQLEKQWAGPSGR